MVRRLVLLFTVLLAQPRLLPIGAQTPPTRADSATRSDAAQRLFWRADTLAGGSAADQRLAVDLYRRAADGYSRAGAASYAAAAFTRIGNLYLQHGRPDSALAYYREGLPIDRAAGDRQGEADALFNIALAFSRLNQPDSAIAMYRLRLPIERSLGDRGGEVETLTQIGDAFDGMGQRDSALACYRRALPVVRAGGDRATEARVLDEIGEIFSRIGEADSALAYARTALPIALLAGDRAAQAISLNLVGLIFYGIGQPDSALTYYRQVLPMQEAGVDPDEEDATLANIGEAFAKLGEPDSALVYLRRAERTARMIGDRTVEVGALVNIGMVFDHAGLIPLRVPQLDSALKYYREALPMTRVAGDRQWEAWTLVEMGVVFDHIGQPDSAIAYFRRALPILHAVRDRVAEATTLGYVGWFFRQVGRPDSALGYFDRSTALSAAISKRAGNDFNRVSFNETTTDFYAQWARAWLSIGHQGDSVAMARAAYASLAASERGRAQALAQLMDTSRAVVPGADLVAEGEALAERLTRSAGTSAMVYMITGDTLITWLLLPGSAIVASEQEVSSERLDTLVAAMRYGVAGVDAEAHRGRGDDVDPTTLPADLVARAVADSGRTLRRELADILLPRTIRERLPARGELIIVPQSGLGLIPFGLLPADASGEALLGDRFALRYGPSLTAINDAADRAGLDDAPGADRTRQLTPALIVGDPTMPRPFRLGGKNYALGDLPGARDEGRAVADSLGTAEWLTGDQATEATVQARLPAARLVHLATHGMVFSSDEHARLSFVALAPDAGHDGHLSVGTIVDSLTLRAELVVLSACQTAVGDIKSAEGTLGLQRAMLAKGARSVLVSLWNVSDVATLFLLQRFYHHWLHDANGPTKSEALRLAQADVRAEGRNPARPEHRNWGDPFYWAAFQLVGAP